MSTHKQTSPALSRRAVLRAAGVCMSLPALDSFITPRLEAVEPKAGAAQAGARLLYIWNPHGPSNIHWHPKGVGRDYKLSPTLEPMADFREQMTVLSGPAHCLAPTGAGHEIVPRTLTGFLPGDNTHSAVTRISVDQIAAQHLGANTRFPSIQVGCNEGVGPVVQSRTLSFNKAGRGLPSIKDTKALFKRLFISSDAKSLAEADQRFDDQVSVLDEVGDQFKHLEKQLGSVDRHRLEHFQDSVREVEKQIERDRKWSKVPKPKIDANSVDLSGKNRADWVRTMCDILALAFQTNSTRVASMLWGIERDGYKWGEFNAKPHHALQHHNGDELQLGLMHNLDRGKITLLHHLCTRLAKADVPGGNLLDQTMIWYGHSSNNGGPGYDAGTGVHYTRDLSHLVVGGGAFGLKHGKHLLYESTKMPLANLWVTMMRQSGIEFESFADSTGVIDDMLKV